MADLQADISEMMCVEKERPPRGGLLKFVGVPATHQILDRYQDEAVSGLWPL
jgi:hypothetical protein